jgi:hypothetical protein
MMFFNQAYGLEAFLSHSRDCINGWEFRKIEDFMKYNSIEDIIIIVSTLCVFLFVVAGFFSTKPDDTNDENKDEKTDRSS